MSFHINKKAVFTDLNGIKIIRNLDNNSFIALTEEGDELLNNIKSNFYINYNLLSQNLKQLIDTCKLMNIIFDNDCPNPIYNKHIIKRSAYLHITNKCNLHCIGCYSLDNKRNNSEDLSLKNIKKIITILKENNINKLMISGGEPFSREDLNEILKFAKHNVAIEKVIMATNGTMINDTILNQIKPYIDMILVSIYGFNEKFDSFIRDKGIFPTVINSIKLIKSNKIPVSILPTLHSKNIQYIDKYMSLSKKLNVPIQFSILTCDCNNKELVNYLPKVKQLKALLTDNIKSDIMKSPMDDLHLTFGKYCGAGNLMISIDSNGDVYPCHMLHRQEMLMGNILYDDFNKILNSDIGKLFESLDVNNFNDCNDCKYKYFCRGGCRARAYYINHNIHDNDPLCEFYKEHFDIFSKMLQQLNKKHKAI